MLQLIGGELLGSHEKQHNPRIDVATARCHRDAAHRSHTHAGIDGHAFAQRHDAGSRPQMGADDAPGQLRAQSRDNRLVRKPVEPVAFDAEVVQALRQRKMPCPLGHGAVEGSVEARILRDAGQELLHFPNEPDRRRNVDGGKLRGCLQRTHQRVRDPLMVAQMRTTVDHPMTDGGGLLLESLGDSRADFLHSLALRTETEAFVEKRDARGVLDLQASIGMPDTRRSAGQQQRRIAACRKRSVKAELQRRRAAVDRQDEIAITGVGSGF